MKKLPKIPGFMKRGSRAEGSKYEESHESKAEAKAEGDQPVQSKKGRKSPGNKAIVSS